MFAKVFLFVGIVHTHEKHTIRFRILILCIAPVINLYSLLTLPIPDTLFKTSSLMSKSAHGRWAIT